MPRVLITDADQRSVVAAIRGLAAGGYAVTAGASVRPAAGHWSRACALRLRLPDRDADDGIPFVRAIAAELRGEGGYVALLPGTDETMLLLARHRALLPDDVPGLPPSAVVVAALDKRRLLDLAAEAGVPAPASEVVDTIDEVVASAARLSYPVVLKPSSSAGSGPRRTARGAADEGALRGLAETYRAPFIVQRRLVDARVVSVGAVAYAGRLRAIAVSRFERTWPPEAGSASSSTTIAPPTGLVERCEMICARLGLEGVLELELLEDADGTLALIDLNPRVYGSLALAIDAGANLPAVWCDLLCGHDPDLVVARPGVRYRWEEAELLNLLAAIRAFRARKVIAIARPRRGTVGALLSLHDPLPLVARGAELLARRFVRRR